MFLVVEAGVRRYLGLKVENIACLLDEAACLDTESFFTRCDLHLKCLFVPVVSLSFCLFVCLDLV